MKRIGIFSDLHAAISPCREAISIFREHEVSAIFCAGDIAGYGEELLETVDLLIENDCNAVKGNHEAWYLEKPAIPEKIRLYFQALPYYKQITIEDKSIYMVHAHPPDAIMGGMKFLDLTGEINKSAIEDWKNKITACNCDVLIIGHTHQVFAVNVDNTLVINPGSTKYNNSCAVLELPEMKINWFGLGGKNIDYTWNWSNQIKN